MKKILFLFVALISAQISFSQEAQKVEKTGGGDALVFEYTEYNYGDIKRGGDGTCTFTFTNNSDTPAILSNVKASCGCTTPSWPHEPIAPGATAEIKVKYDTNRVGNFTKYVNVSSNKSTQPIRLTIMGKVFVEPVK